MELVGDDRSLQRAFKSSSRGAKSFEHDIGRASRGAISAAVSFRGLGRAMAFSSAQFLGGAGIVYALKSTISAAEKSQSVLAQTANAVKRSGNSWNAYGKQIKAAALEQANISGFDDERLLGTFSNLVRKTGDVNQALKLNALAANVARGRNISLEAAQQLVLKASLGMAGALRRVGIDAKKGATSVQLVQMLTQKYANSAKAYGLTAAGAQDRFRVAVENLQEAIGSGLLPTITKTLNPLTTWLNKSANQERVQRDVTAAVKVGVEAFKTAAHAVRLASDAVGGLTHLLEILLALKLVSWARSAAVSFGLVGAEATVATSRVAALRASLTGLGAISIAPIVIPVALSMAAKQKAWLKQHLGKAGAAGFDAVFTAAGGGVIGGPKAVLNDLFGGDKKKTTAASPKPHSGTGFRDVDLSNPTGVTGVGTPAALDRSSQIQNRVANARLASARGEKGAQAELVAALKEQIDFDKKYAAIQQRLYKQGGKDAKKHADAYRQLVADETSALSEISGMQTKSDKNTAAASKKAWSERLKMLQAAVVRASGTKGVGDDIKALQAEQAALKQRIREHGKTGDLEMQLARVQKQLAGAKKKAPVNVFAMPFALQLAQAKAATTQSDSDDIAVARKMKAFAQKMIKSGKLRGQAIIDAWDAIAAANSVIGDSMKHSTQVAVSSAKLTAGLGLSNAQRKALEARYAQAEAHSGRVPTGHAVAGQSVNIGTVHVHGVKNADELVGQLQRKASHAAVQTRGPHAGRNARVH